jgi:hypothetical protein
MTEDIDVAAEAIEADDDLSSSLDDLDFEFFHANSKSQWLPLVSGKVNWLASVWYLENKNSTVEEGAHAQRVFVDSALLSVIGRVIKGKEEPAAVDAWLNDQERVAGWAWRLYEAGSLNGVAAMIDHNASDQFLRAVNRSWSDSLEWTLRNAEAWMDMALPPTWKPVYVVQGTTLAQYEQCMTAYDMLGVLDAVRSGEAWLAIGSIAAKRPPALYTLVESVRHMLGEGHIHVLGIGSKEYLEHMVPRGWCQSSDSASVCMRVVNNTGGYSVVRTDLPRSAFFYYAQFAAEALLWNYELGGAVMRRGALRRAGLDSEQVTFDGLAVTDR